MSSTSTTVRTERNKEQAVPNKKPLHPTFLAFARAGFSSLVGKVFSAPLHLLSVVSKVDQELVRQNRLDRPYSGPIDAATRIFKAEGVLGLWRGFALNIPGYYIVPALNLVSKTFVTRTLFKHSSKDPYWIQFTKGLFSGVVSGALSLALVHPFRITSFKYLTDVPSENGRKYSGILAIWKDIFTTDGVLGFFTGFGTQILALFLYRLFYFGAYDLYRTLIRKPKSATEGFWLGWFSTVIGMAVSYPFAVIQDRLMITAGSNKKYSSMAQMVSEIWHNEGIFGFWRGFAISFATSSGLGAARALYDYAVKYLVWKPHP